VLNGWTIVLGLLAACVAFAADKRTITAVASIVILILAMLPALIGGLGLLFMVPIVSIFAGLPRLQQADDRSAVESPA
jgi:uncharacterized membrane protein